MDEIYVAFDLRDSATLTTSTCLGLVCENIPVMELCHISIAPVRHKTMQVSVTKLSSI
jgi:hypothetical protein